MELSKLYKLIGRNSQLPTDKEIFFFNEEALQRFKTKMFRHLKIETSMLETHFCIATCMYQQFEMKSQDITSDSCPVSTRVHPNKLTISITGFR